MADEAPRLPKPKMRGMIYDQIKRNITKAIVFCAVGGILFQYLYINRRKNIYADFYKNYDIEGEFNIIRRKGLFDSCDPWDEEEDKDEK